MAISIAAARRITIVVIAAYFANATPRAIAAGTASVPRSPTDPPGDRSAAVTQLDEEVDLARLIDLCAKRSGFAVEYDPNDVAGTIIVREASAITDAELWSLTNELLATRGLASIQRPGTRVLSIVRTEKARGATRVATEGIDADSRASYQSVLLRVKHRDAKSLVESMRSALGREAAAATAIGDSGLIVVTDYVERIREWIDIMAMVDVPETGVIVESVRLRHVRAPELVATATAMLAAREEPGSRKLRGRPTAVGESTVVLVGPEEDLRTWKSILDAFDAPPDTRIES